MRASPDTVVIIPAAGRGERLGSTRPKALVELAGESLLRRALHAALSSKDVVGAVVAAPPDSVDAVMELCHDVRSGSRAQLLVVPGGTSRQASVALAFAAAGQLSAAWSVGLVHDAARALAPVRLFDRVAQAVRDGHPAVFPVVPIADTLRRVDISGGVVETLDRRGLHAVQTPQGFSRAALQHMYPPNLDLDALERTGATDDVALAESLGYPLHAVPGEPSALKITYASDIRLAWSFLSDLPT